MFIYRRLVLGLLLVLPVVVLAAPPAPSDKAKPAAVPALPATLDVVTFLIHSEGENHKVIVTTAPSVMRVDLPGEDYSVIYTDQTEHYTGLEHSNYTYWQFSWPEVQVAVESSKRYESRMQELNLDGINADPNPPATNAPADTNVTGVPDTSGYVWKQTPEHRNVAGLDCVHWVGENGSGDRVEAWCYNGVLPKVQAAVARLNTINEPMALVAVRTIVPPFAFPVFNALTKGGVTPVLITWGGQSEKNSFAFVEAKSRPTKANLFVVPTLYMKTTLITMDGLIEQKK